VFFEEDRRGSHPYSTFIEIKKAQTYRQQTRDSSRDKKN
jgi:hypothetical protein